MDNFRLVTRDQLISEFNIFSIMHPTSSYTLKFKRAIPKCTECGKKSKKWQKGVDTHCQCGGVIEYDKVENIVKIRSINKDSNTFFYFVNGSMKQCLIDNIISITLYCNGSHSELFLVNITPHSVDSLAEQAK